MTIFFANYSKDIYQLNIKIKLELVGSLIINSNDDDCLK
jgi:hypothetical protein